MKDVRTITTDKPEEKYTFQVVSGLRQFGFLVAVAMLTVVPGTLFLLYYSDDQEEFITVGVLGIAFTFVAFLSFTDRFCLEKEEVTFSDRGIKSLKHGEILFSDMLTYTTRSSAAINLVIWRKNIWRINNNIAFSQIHASEAFMQFRTAFENHVADYNESEAGKENPIGNYDPVYRSMWFKAFVVPVLILATVGFAIVSPSRAMIVAPLAVFALIMALSSPSKK